MDAPAGRSELDAAFLGDVLDGLSAPVRAIPARWFYDARGSQLFDEITRLPEYHLTRAETDLLRRHAPDLAMRIAPGGALVELGSGSATKTPILLRALQPAAYVPVDISAEHLAASAAGIARDFPGLAVHPLAADFTRAIALPDAIAGLSRLAFFPGSTIGNFVPASAVDLLRSLKAGVGVGSQLLIGLDLAKPEAVLVPAYDDPQGVTAAFNLNLLERINRELDADIPVDRFRHRAVWNETRSRIEMHLEATSDLRFAVAGHPFAMRAGETIHTENSHKYGRRDARRMLLAGGWHAVAEYADADDSYALVLAEAEPARFAP